MCVFLYISILLILFFFFFNDTATTEIYTLSLHDALPILTYGDVVAHLIKEGNNYLCSAASGMKQPDANKRSEEHTSELQSRLHLVCRLLLEKKKKKTRIITFKRRNVYERSR